MDQQEKAKRQRITLKSQVDDFETEISEIKKRLNNQQKEMANAQKQITMVETKLEQKRADRHSLLKACKVCHCGRLLKYKRNSPGFLQSGLVFKLLKITVNSFDDK